MSIKYLFFDFDGVYKDSPPDDDTLVLTNLYRSKHSYNVSSNNEFREQIYDEFIKSISTSSANSIFKYYDPEELNMYFFLSFYYPIGQWITKINELIESNVVDENTEIIFSSYSNNRFAFIFEAEGETNTQLLYKKSYFLSYYLKEYLKVRGLTCIRILNTQNLKVKISFFSRGILVMLGKILQLLVYKIFTFKRFFNIDIQVYNEPLVAISSRGIVQTQYISNLYKSLSKNALLIINESSSRPYRNLKEAKKNKSFYYAEGNIKFNELINEIIKVIHCYKSINKTSITTFFGIEINLFHLLPECSIKLFHLKTYALSINNSLVQIEKKLGLKFNKIVSMEMLPPFAYFIKKVFRGNVIQIQCSTINGARYPNFVYSDKFYFSDLLLYKVFCKMNPESSEQYSLLQNVKYVDMIKLPSKNKFKNITYFSQPIYQEEENKLIAFLNEFCKSNDLRLRIKLHPRSSISNMNLRDIEILDGALDSRQVVSMSDIVATRNSAIGMDCWFLNIPVLFFVNGTLKGDSISYIPEDYKGNIKMDITSSELSSNLNNIIDDFYHHPHHKFYKVDNDLIKRELLK